MRSSIILYHVSQSCYKIQEKYELDIYGFRISLVKMIYLCIFYKKRKKKKKKMGKKNLLRSLISTLNGILYTLLKMLKDIPESLLLIRKFSYFSL